MYVGRRQRRAGILNARYGGGDNRLAYRVYGRGFTRGPQFHSDGRNFDDWRRARQGFAWIGAHGARHADAAGERLPDLCGDQARHQPVFSAIADEPGGNGDFSGQNLVAGWRRTFRSGSDVQVRAYFDRTDRADLNYREVRDTVDVDIIHHVPLSVTT